MLLASKPAGAAGLATVAVDAERITFQLKDVEADQTIALRESRVYEPEASQGGTVWSGKVNQQIVVPRFDGDRDRLFSRFALADPVSQELLGLPRFADDLLQLPSPNHELTWPEEIKGVSCPVHLDDLRDLGVRHVHLNISLSQAFLSNATGTTDPAFLWRFDGTTFAFHPTYIQQLDAQIKRLTTDGINVVAVILNPVPSSHAVGNPLIHPRTDLTHAPNGLGAFNLTDEDGLRHYIAFFQFMAHRYSLEGAPHGLITGYIIGNEIDTHWQWHNLGRISLKDLVAQHAAELRMAVYAVSTQHPGIRIFTSFTHAWTRPNMQDPLQAVPGRELLDRLASKLREEGDVPWNLAHHPYPQDLFQPRFWQDELATFAYDTPMVTLKNLEVMLDYLQQDHLRFQGRPRRVILSEQGFHAGESERDEAIQAAAFALAYQRIRQMPMVDAFILHRHVDHRHEGGLKLGLWTADPAHKFPSQPQRKRPIWHVFAAAGTDRQEAAFAFALPLVELNVWDDAKVVPGPFTAQALPPPPP